MYIYLSLSLSLCLSPLDPKDHCITQRFYPRHYQWDPLSGAPVAVTKFCVFSKSCLKPRPPWDRHGRARGSPQKLLLWGEKTPSVLSKQIKTHQKMAYQWFTAIHARRGILIMRLHTSIPWWIDVTVPFLSEKQAMFWPSDILFAMIDSAIPRWNGRTGETPCFNWLRGIFNSKPLMAPDLNQSWEFQKTTGTSKELKHHPVKT